MQVAADLPLTWRACVIFVMCLPAATAFLEFSHISVRNSVIAHRGLWAELSFAAMNVFKCESTVVIIASFSAKSIFETVLALTFFNFILLYVNHSP